MHSGKKQPSSSTMLHFMLHLRMLRALGRVPGTPAQAIYPSFHPAPSGLVQVGSLCSALVLREGEFPEVKPERGSRHQRGGHRREVALLFHETWTLPCLRVTGVTISCDTVANLWSLGMPVDTHWCTSWRWGFSCLKMLWALHLIWHGPRVMPGNVTMLCASRVILLKNGEGAQKLFKWGGQREQRK